MKLCDAYYTLYLSWHGRYKYHCQSRCCQCCFYYCRFICFVEHILIIDILCHQVSIFEQNASPSSVITIQQHSLCEPSKTQASSVALPQHSAKQWNNDISISRLKKQRKTFFHTSTKREDLVFSVKFH